MLPTRALLVTFLLLAAMAAVSPLAADASPPRPRLVRVTLAPESGVEGLLAAGLDVIEVESPRSALVLEWPHDAAALARLSLPIEILDPDPTATANRRSAAELASRPAPRPARVRSAARADGVTRIEALPPFGSGSWNGYWSPDEIKMELDSLVADDPRGLVADRLDTLGYSWEGRPIWGLRLGRTAPEPDTRPVVFMNALTHAREPGGMQALFYFVHHLLTAHGGDPFATALLEQRVLYVAPLVNPDGYAYNGPGGLWRKNRHGSGVDLNRNFGYQWGYDNVGSSPTPTSATYRGPAPFSEPETRAQRDAVIALEPATGVSIHTYGDLFLHPWGYVSTLAPHAAAFREWCDLATRWNRYSAGEFQRILYAANGDINDWAYGDTLAKPRAFTWTPEIGTSSDGFWPPPSRIVPLASECLHLFYTVTALAGAHVQLEEHLAPEGALVAGGAALLAPRVRNHGLRATGPGLTATLVSLDAGIEVLSGVVHYPALPSRAGTSPAGSEAFLVAAADSVTPGRRARLRCEFADAAGGYSRDTLDVIVGAPTRVFEEHGTPGFPAWVPPVSAALVTGSAAHPSAFVRLNDIDRLVLTGALDLSRGVHAWVVLDAAWNGDPGSFSAALPGDFSVIVEASLDSVLWTALSGTTTVAPSIPGQTLAPGFLGNQYAWVQHWLDLSPLTGPAATRVRFRMRTNSLATATGTFDFDSLRVLLYDPRVQPPVAVGAGAAPARLALSPARPNPARGAARFELDVPRAGRVDLEVLDLQGRRVAVLEAGVLEAGRHARAWDLRDARGGAAAAGVYLVRLRDANAQVVRRLAVVR